eukprot:15764660-Heterocapsa_arctica.AAC.1
MRTGLGGATDATPMSLGAQSSISTSAFAAFSPTFLFRATFQEFLLIVVSTHTPKTPPRPRQLGRLLRRGIGGADELRASLEKLFKSTSF